MIRQALLSTLTCAIAAAWASEPLRPVVLAQRGEVQVVDVQQQTRSVRQGDALSAGERLESSANARCALALAPGQLVTLRGNGRLVLERLHDDSGGAHLKLEKGSLLCHLHEKRPKQQPPFELQAGNQRLSARGTLWTTTVTPDGDVFTSVLHSTVSLTLGDSGVAISVQAGRVVISRYSAAGEWLQTSLIDLTSGQKILYLADAPDAPLESLATAVELGAAAAGFQQALNSAAGWTAESIEGTNLLITQINALLSAQGLPLLTAPNYRADPLDPLSDNRDTLIASPDAPPGGM
jgi:hypothetical protein